MICDKTTPQASASGKVSAGWTFWRELNFLCGVSPVEAALPGALTVFEWLLAMLLLYLHLTRFGRLSTVRVQD